MCTLYTELSEKPLAKFKKRKDKTMKGLKMKRLLLKLIRALRSQGKSDTEIVNLLIEILES